MRKIRHKSSGDVKSYWMKHGLSDGTGYFKCYLACWKFTFQLHFDNTCTSSDSFQEAVNKQRTIIGSSYISWHDIVRGVPQGSLLGPFFLTYL